MNEFRFDLQRFAATWDPSTVKKNNKWKYTCAYTDNDDKTQTATITGTFSEMPSGDPVNGITFSATGTLTDIELNGKTYHLELNGKAKLTFKDDGTVEFNVLSDRVDDFYRTDNGSNTEIYDTDVTLISGYLHFRKSSEKTVTLGDDGPAVTLKGSYVSANIKGTGTNNVEVGKASSISVGIFTYSPTFTSDSPLGMTLSNKKLYLTLTSTGSSDGNSTTKTAICETTNADGETITETYEVVSGNVQFVNDADGNLYLAGTKNSFTKTVGETTITYTRGLKSLWATATNSTRVNLYTKETIDESTEVLSSNLDLGSDFKSDNFLPVYIATNDALVLSDLIKSLDTDDGISICGSLDENNDYSLYGKFSKATDSDGNTYYKLEGVYGKNFSSVTIDAEHVVQFDEHFSGVPITVSNSNTTFSTTDSNAFSISSGNGSLSIGGSNSVSLSSGSITTDSSIQTIFAGEYSVAGYGGGTDGLIFSRTSSVDNMIVSDIDKDEHFNVGADNYTLLGAGLLEKSGDVYSLYRDYANKDTTSVTLGSLGEGIALIEPNDSVLSIGSNITGNALVFDSKTNPSKGYASIFTSGSNHTLTTLEGTDTVDFSSGISTISLTSGETTVYKNLIADDTVIASASGTTFLVTAVEKDTFTVKNVTDTPTVDDAKAITLIKGSLIAKTGQTITLGQGGNSFEVVSTDSDNLLVTLEGNKATITGTAGDEFKFDGKNYKVDTSGNGLTFTLNSNDTVVTIGGLDTDEIFTYDGTQYSLKSAGFIKGNYSLLRSSADSVQADSLTSSDWKTVATVGSSNIVTISADPTLTAFITEDFSKTYGTVEKQANGVYYFSRDTNDSTLPAGVSLNGVESVSLYNTFDKIPIQTANSTINVTSSGSVYQVTVYDGTTSLNGASAVSLISGSLTADSNISDGALIYGKTIKAASEVTLISGDSSLNASIAGLSVDEQFSVDSKPYTLTGAGLLNNNNKLLYGSKPNGNSDDNRILLDSIGNGIWYGMIPADATLTIDSGTATELSLVVDKTDAPTSIFGELKPDGSGYSLTTADGYDAWNKDYTIKIDATTVTISNDFVNASIAGEKSSAAFTIDSLTSGATSFVITDGTSGASLGNVAAITQTKGLIAQSGLQTINIGSDTISNSDGLGVNVSVNGNEATLSALDSNDIFTINGTNYSVKGLGVMTDDQFLKDSADKTEATLSELKDLTNKDWVYIAEVSNASLFSVPPATNSKGEWIIFDADRTTRFGTLSTINGGYSIAKESIDSAWGENTIQVGSGSMLSLSGDFAGAKISVGSSKAEFTVGDPNVTYTVTDSNNAASIGGNAKTINQTAGTIALNSNDQTIIAGTQSISGAGDDVTVFVENSKATVGALKSDDKFKVGNYTYTLLSNGRFYRTEDKTLWNAGTIATDDTGSIAVESLGADSNWNGVIDTDSSGNLTIGSAVQSVLSSVSSAFVVNDATIYGTMTKDGENYTLNTTGKTNATLNSIEFTSNIPTVSLTSDFVNVSLKANSNEFTATTAKNGFKVNYDGTNLSVDEATAVNLSNGTLILSSINSAQTITAGTQTATGSSESVNVSYDGTTVTIDGIETLNESLTFDGNVYSLSSGDGFSIKSANGTTTIEGITTGDKFKIGDETFIYTAAGLGKTEANTDKLTFLLKAINPGDNKMTLADLQSTDEDIWLGIYLAEDGKVTINNDMIASVVLVDNLDNPTTNYGQVVRDSNGAYTLGKYTGSDEALSSVSNVKDPTAITVESGITATIDSVYSTIPVTANKATSITVTDKDSKDHTISGTVDKFIPSTMTFTPKTDETFTVDDSEYLMTGAGLTKTKSNGESVSEIWTKEGISEYILPDEDAWSNLIKLTENNTLDLSIATAKGENNVVVDSNSSTRWATIIYTESTNTYELTAKNNKEIPTVQLADGDAIFKVPYATTIKTGDGTYTINGKAYTGDDLEISATAETSTLQNGTVTLDKDAQAITPSNDNALAVTSGEITATAKDGEWDSLGGLTNGDTFTIDGTTYQILGDNANTLVKLDASGTPEKLYTGFISNGTLNYKDVITNGEYSDVVQLNTDNQLDLTKELNITTAIVVGQKNGAIDPTNRIAQLNCADNAYTLSDPINLDDLKAVLLENVTTFNTALETTVLTKGTNTFTINDLTLNAQNDLTVATENSNAYLTNGAVTLAANNSIVTRYTSAGSNVDETIETTAGAVTVTADNTANTITINGLSATDGDVFTVNGIPYTMTAVGLVDNQNQLNYDAATGSITTAKLSGDDWKKIVSAKDGNLTISGEGGFVANIDLDNPANAVKYGTLTADNGAYTLTQDDDGDATLSSVKVSGVKATLSNKCAGNTTIVTEDGEFTVTTKNSEAFTIDATESTLKFDNVSVIELTKGEIAATVDTPPITAGGKTIELSDGEITVGIDDGKVYVDKLTVNDTFKVDGVEYKMTAAGLLNTGSNLLEESISEDDKFYPDDLDGFTKIIAVESDGFTLNLDGKPSAEVYDSTENPSKHMATLEVTDTGLTLLEQDENEITTVELGDGKTLTIDFAATINASGTTTVNGQKYAGTTGLVIDSIIDSEDDRNNTSRLQSGTITLNTGEKAQATEDTTALEVTSGTITATAEGGQFKKVGGLDAGEEFTFDNETYKQSAVGLIKDSTISEELAGTSIELNKLSTTEWKNFIAPTNGTLDITKPVNALVLDNTTLPNSKLAELSIEADGTINLNDNKDNDTDIAAVNVATGAVLAVDFTTKVNAPIGDVTVNGNAYNGTTALVIDSDGTTSTLYEGTVKLDAVNPEVTATKESSTLKIEGDSAITAKVESGEFVTLGDVQAGESFTLDGVTYTQTAVGLRSKDGINENLASETINVADIKAAVWTDIIVPKNNTLDLTGITANTLVCDKVDNPTVKYADLTVENDKLTLKDNGTAAEAIKTINIDAGDNLTVDFTTQVHSPIGKVTVNGATYNGTTELLLDAKDSTSTLTSGTVSLSNGDSVKTTTGNEITASDGDGVTVNANGNSITVNSMNTGDIFQVDGITYKIAPSDLIDMSGSKFWKGEAYGGGLTVDALKDPANWLAVVVAKDGALNITDTSIANSGDAVIVDDLENPTKIYGTLNKDDNGDYTLTTKDADSTLSSINVSGVKADIGKDLVEIPLTINDSTALAVTTSEDTFEVDATGDLPKVDNVSAIEISTGKIELRDGQKITLADDYKDVEISAGTGAYNIGEETFTIDGNTLRFTFDADGEANEIHDFEKGTTVAIDGITYTAPSNNAVLHYGGEEDLWYFDAYSFEEFTVIVDEEGNVTVAPGMKFSDVVSSGRKLGSDNTIKFSADINNTPVTVISGYSTAFSIENAEGNTLAENFGKNNMAKFTGDGVEADTLEEIADVSFNLQNGQSIVTEKAEIVANADNSTVGVGANGKSLSLDKSAQINAPKDIELTLNTGNYKVNGVVFTAGGATSATTTDDGVKIDLAKSDPLTYNEMTFSNAGTATMDDSYGVTVTSGAVVENAESKTLTVEGTVLLDDKTINAATATEVTATASGINVGSRRLIVTGDDDGYIVNISNDDISGLENIGNSAGVTVEGLNDATVKTDKAGSFTSDDKTFIYSNATVTYGFGDGEITSISGVNTVIGDFTDEIIVNGDSIKLVGDSDSEVTVIGNGKEVKKVEVNSGGVYTVGSKIYEIQDDDSFAFDVSKGVVSGIESLESGNLIIRQNESAFNVNSEKITLSGNDEPVTLGIVDSKIASVSGVDGIVSGLNNATVYGLDSAVINDKTIDVSNSEEFNVIVKRGKAIEITGVTDGATINSAPNMTVTAENGTFTFVKDEYILNDTLDGVYDFLTDSNSRVKGLNRYSGSIGGPFDKFTLNGKTLNLPGNVTVETDGINITNIIGLEDGGSIDGDIGDSTLVIPEGEITINNMPYKLEGDEDGATLSGNGSVISGVDKDATLTFGGNGTYAVDGKTFDVKEGDSLTSNRDGVYKIDPDNPPITEKTDTENILSRNDNPIYIEPSLTGETSVDLTGDNDFVLIDSADAQLTVTTGAGNDSVIVRHGSDVTVDLNDEGETLIIPTAGKVTLENYDGDNAAIQTFEYSNLIGAVKSNEIKFGNGVMTLGDATIAYDTIAPNVGYTTTKLINAHGQQQEVAFTHSRGGTIDLSDSTKNYLVKGNYAENSSDTQKSGGSTITGGEGNDTILAGSTDSIDGGGGNNQIYLTDSNLRKISYEGATILLNENGRDTVHSFATGFKYTDDKIFIKNLDDIIFGYGTADLVMSSSNGYMAFANPAGDSTNSTYELKLTDGTNDYNAAVAQEGKTISVEDGNNADVFFGNENGISFSEYTGDIEVNLNDSVGTLNDKSVRLFNIDKAEAGAGNSSLIGAAGTSNTLIGGTGDSSIWSNSGKDLMIGNTSEDKRGSTTFFYLPDDGRDSIESFDFMDSSLDTTADRVQLDDNSGVTDVLLRGDDVLIGINNSTDDYLMIADAKGKSFRLNDDLIAKVDTAIEYDGFTNCYVGYGTKATMNVGRDMDDVAIWLSDDSLEYHGIMYDGNIGVLDASQANGNNTLAGNEFDNLIIGGSGNNSMWGGYASSNDTLIGGAGQNTFFFALENGHDVIQGAHDGDIVSLEDIYLENIVRADITGNGVFVELTDGSSLEVQSNAAVDYRLQDGTTYTADHVNRQWIQK